MGPDERILKKDEFSAGLDFEEGEAGARWSEELTLLLRSVTPGQMEQTTPLSLAFSWMMPSWRAAGSPCCARATPLDRARQRGSVVDHSQTNLAGEFAARWCGRDAEGATAPETLRPKGPRGNGTLESEDRVRSSTEGVGRARPLGPGA